MKREIKRKIRAKDLDSFEFFKSFKDLKSMQNVLSQFSLLQKQKQRRFRDRLIKIQKLIDELLDGLLDETESVKIGGTD